MCCSVVRFGAVPINTCSAFTHTRVYTQDPRQLYDVGDVYNRMWASAKPESAAQGQSVQPRKQGQAWLA